MGVKINFDENFDNEILNEINEKYDIGNTDDNSKNNIIIDLNDFSFFKNELYIFKKLKIIDRQTNKLNIVRYNIFRKFIKKETIKGIKGDEIRRKIELLNKSHNDYKLLLFFLSHYGFEESKITQNKDYQFENNNELQIISLLIVFGKELFDKMNAKNDELVKRKVYKDMILYGSNGKKELSGFQNKLCELVFSDENKYVYEGIILEEEIYGNGLAVGTQLKSLVKQINLKGKEIGYNDNILSYRNANVIRNISIYI